MQNPDDVEGGQRPQTAEMPGVDKPAGAPGEAARHLGRGSDPAGREHAVENSDADASSVEGGARNTPAKE